MAHIASATSSHARGPRLILVLGLAAAAALFGAALLDLGDPGAAVRSRMARGAATEADRVRLEFARMLADPAPLAPALGEVLAARASDDAPDEARDASEGPRDAPEGPRDAPAQSGAAQPERASAAPAARVFEALFDAALAAAVEGHIERASQLVEDALAKASSLDTPRHAEAHLRALAWSHALGADAQAAAHRAALLALPPERARDGLPYHVLAVLAGPQDDAALRRVHAALVHGDLPRPAARDTVKVSSEAGLSLALDPTLNAVRRALEERAPDLDWEAAFDLSARRTRALHAWLPRGVAAREGEWRLFTPPELGDEDGDLVCALYSAGDTWRVLALSRAALASRLVAATRGGSATGQGLGASEATRDFDVQIRARADVDSQRAPAAEAAPVARLLGPASLGATGLTFEVVSATLEAEVARERRRITLLRLGLVGLGALVALAGWLASRALARERRLSQLRSTFVASVSHDLRTPLSSILLMVENLQRGHIATDSARAKYHGALRQEAERLRRMVEDLLDASRVDRGEGPRLARVPTDVSSFFDELEVALSERAALAGARLSVTRARLPQSLLIDPDAVRRAVWNLVENALRHGKRAGAAADVQLAIRERAGALELDVIDAGPGVPARHREAIFAPYERLANARERSSLADDTGTGLGLAIVRAIARAHGGDARLVERATEAALGAAPERSGAHFRLTLPLEPDEGVA
ncbi:MAG: HAMP domain-containing sensor histidine kinase [Planctomycetota bacterium]